MVRGRFLRDGITYGQDIVFLDHFDCSDHVFNDGLVPEALNHTLDRIKITKGSQKRAICTVRGLQWAFQPYSVIFHILR